MDVSPINNKPKTTKTGFIKKFRLTPKQKKIWTVILTTLLVLAILAGVYGYAYNKGYKNGEAAGKKNTAANASDIFNNVQNPFKTLTGQVEKVEGETVTITTSKGETKTVKLTDKTKITKKTETLNKDSLTKGTKVTIFTQGEDSNISATRVVVR